MDTVTTSDASIVATPSALDRLLSSIQETLKLFDEYASTHRPPWAAHARRLRMITEFVEQQHQISADGCELPKTIEQIGRFGALLHAKREQARLTQRELAKLSGLTAQTINNIEKGRTKNIGRQTMLCLRGVPQLDLQTAELEAAMKHGPGYNCHIPDSFDTVGMINDLEGLLNGPGCHIEQTNAYLDHRSAIAYIAETQNPAFVSRFREAYPSKKLAYRIVTEAGQVPFKVVALGPGDGHLEVRFVQHLLGRLQPSEISLVLLDISNPLLTTAHKHAKELLGDRVDTSMVLGNFHDLAKFPQATTLDPKVAGRQKRIYLMMGFTLSNLDHEPRFFSYAFNHCTEGDFLIVDFQKRHCELNASDSEIMRRDPALNCPFPESRAKWLEVPLKAHVPDLISSRFSAELSTAQCPIPHSYMLENIATVKVRGQQEKRFSMLRVKRYDEASLTRSLARFGWHCVESVEFGPEKNTVAMLLVKRALAH